MFGTTFVGLALVASAPGLKDPPAKPITVEGEWAVVSALAGGKPDPALAGNPVEKIIITANKWIVVRGGMPSYETAIALDPKQDPPHMDLSQSGEAGVGTRAIYRLDGDSLVICYTTGADRPTTIGCPLNSNVRMVTLKRLKK